MQVAPFSFKEFSSGVPEKAAARAKSFLPGGRQKEEAPPPPPPPPSFSEEQLKTAEREAYKKGFVEGTQEGLNQANSEQAAVDRALSETVEKFIHSVAPLVQDYRSMALQLRQDMPKVAHAIARKAAGNALAENASAAIDEVALRCVETMIGEPKLAITVHSSLADALERKVKSLTERLQSANDVTVIKDESIAVSDCRIEWKHGAMERHTGQLWQQIDKAVEALSASATRTTEIQINALETPLPPQQTKE